MQHVETKKKKETCHADHPYRLLFFNGSTDNAQSAVIFDTRHTCAIIFSINPQKKY